MKDFSEYAYKGELNDKDKDKNSESSISSKSSSPPKASSPSPKEIFEKDFSIIKKMRDKKTAPVDTMGASYCPDSTIKTTDFKTFKFQALVSLILSAQTKDNVTLRTTKNLIKHGLTIDSMLNTPQEKIAQLIYGVSFHNNKAKAIVRLAKYLHENCDDDPPETLKEVLELPGIGNKMGLLYLKDCCGLIEGIAVDTHVHKIANRLSWVETTNADKTRIELERIVDKKYWEELNEILVGFGQETCKSVGPKCDECLLRDSCKYYKDVVLVKKKEKEKEKAKKGSKPKSKKRAKGRE